MSKNKVMAGIQGAQSANALSLRPAEQDQTERLIAIRLHTATNLEVNQDASIAWMERKIIRDRMRYYTSTHTKVIN